MTRQISDLVAALEDTSDDDLYDTHGIELFADGTVYDTIERVTYASLVEWVEAQEFTMSTTTFVKKQTRAKFNE